MSISKKLDETLDSLNLTEAALAARQSLISQSMRKMRDRMPDLDIEVESTIEEKVAAVAPKRYKGTELADTARQVYRANINPVDKSEVEKKAPKDQPSTIAGRANVTAIARSLAGMRSSGNEGKASFVGPNGVGNVGKVSPTGSNGVGNLSNPGGNYYALTTDMTLEEYEEHVNNIFEGDDCGVCEHEKQEKTKKEIKARGGPPGYPDKSVKKEDVVHELEQRLVTLGSTDWIQVDKVLRETAREYGIAPRTISREFKYTHGMYPDKWIKEHLDIEVCGYMPLEEAARLNKVGKIYEVTFMFRGGTNRLKFFWPSPGDATKEDMQHEIDKFWPKAKVIAFYPTIDNEQQSNYMVMAPPMTENYHFMQPEDWTELSEDVSELIEIICEEEGEPISPIINEENGYTLFIEDHDTGEERQVFFNEEGLRDWFGKSSSSDGKKGWVNVTTGGTCASDEPGEGTPKCVSSSKRASMSEAERKSASRRKKAADPGQQSKSGAAKPTMVKTDVKEELLDEESDKKGKGSGTKDACYHKVKSRYSVWPSAYASGALVKCRAKGAKNWGNSSKKEEVEYVDESEYWGGPPKVKPAFKEISDEDLAAYDKAKAAEKVFNSPQARGERRQKKRDERIKQGRNPDTGKAKPPIRMKKNEEIEMLDGLKDLMDEGAAWTKKSGKNSKGGLNEKGRKSYEKENPGSDLKAPSKKVGNPRRKSFCARMKGMRKRQKPSNNTGDDRLSKSLRAWNC